MKNTGKTTKRLHLDRQTAKVLSQAQLGQVAGGDVPAGSGWSRCLSSGVDYETMLAGTCR